jgi:hypothetical protein
MNNPRHILMQIQAVIGSKQRTEREIDDFCSWIEVQVMTDLFAGLPKDKQEKAINGTGSVSCRLICVLHLSNCLNQEYFM